MKILKARIFEAERERQAATRAAERKGPGGLGRPLGTHPHLQFPARARLRSPHQSDALQARPHPFGRRSWRNRRCADHRGSGEPPCRRRRTPHERARCRRAALERRGAVAGRRRGIAAGRGAAAARSCAGREPGGHHRRELPAFDARNAGALRGRRWRRPAREPLAYIVGRREFWSLDFAVGPGVLVPRPESEILIEEALRRFPARDAPLRVLDLGTGSGCLLLAFLSERPNATGLGADISDAALATAARNAKALGLESRANSRRGDWTEKLFGAFDAIFINPPYIAKADFKHLAPEIGYEPMAALDGGTDGLEAYRRIATRLGRYLSPSGLRAIRDRPRPSCCLETILAQNGLAAEGTVCDLAGIPRCLVAGVVPSKITPKKELALETRSG